MFQFYRISLYRHSFRKRSEPEVVKKKKPTFDTGQRDI